MNLKRALKIGSIVLLLVASYGNASAFQVERADYEVHKEQASQITSLEKREKSKRFLDGFFDCVKGYDIDIRYNGKIVVIKCPHDGGVTEYAINKYGVSLVTSTDRCKHEIVMSGNFGTDKEFSIYKDEIPFLIADDYLAWKTKGDHFFDITWEKHSQMTQL